MFNLAPNAAIMPGNMMNQIISLIFDPKTAMGGGMSIAILALLYVVFPSIRDAVKEAFSKKEDNRKKKKEDHDDFRRWLIKRTDQLEEERSRRMESVENENETLRDRLTDIEKDIKIQIIRNEETQQRLRNLEWIFLGEICEELLERVSRQKDEISERLRMVGQEELAEAIQKEFEKLINDVREAFLIRNMERTKQVSNKIEKMRENS